MPTLKEYNVKLARLRNTRKMTKSMKLVSANKLRKAQEAQKNAAVYVARVNGILGRLEGLGATSDHELSKPRRRVRTVLALVFTSDRGLCGGFNSNLNKSVGRWCGEQTAAQRRIELSCCGRRGYMFFKSRGEIRTHYEHFAARPAYAHAQHMGIDLQAAFKSGAVDEVYLAYNAFKGIMTHTPVIEKLLPFEPGRLPAAAPAARREDWRCEPVAPKLLETLLPWLVNLRVYAALLNNAAGEHAARMTAMDQATTNADNVIADLSLRRNRARQAAITTELIEVVAGAEALR